MWPVDSVSAVTLAAHAALGDAGDLCGLTDGVAQVTSECSVIRGPVPNKSVQTLFPSPEISDDNPAFFAHVFAYSFFIRWSMK